MGGSEFMYLKVRNMNKWFIFYIFINLYWFFYLFSKVLLYCYMFGDFLFLVFSSCFKLECKKEDNF